MPPTRRRPAASVALLAPQIAMRRFVEPSFGRSQNCRKRYFLNPLQNHRSQPQERPRRRLAPFWAPFRLPFLSPFQNLSRTFTFSTERTAPTRKPLFWESRPSFVMDCWIHFNSIFGAVFGLPVDLLLEPFMPPRCSKERFGDGYQWAQKWRPKGHPRGPKFENSPTPSGRACRSFVPFFWISKPPIIRTPRGEVYLPPSPALECPPYARWLYRNGGADNFLFVTVYP